VLKERNSLLGIDQKAARYTWTAAVVLLLMGLIYVIRETIVIFIIALLFAYLLYPLVDVIDKRLTARTRTPALALAYLICIGLLTVFGAFIGGQVLTQARYLSQNPPDPEAFIDNLGNQHPQLKPALDYVKGDFRSRARDLMEKAPQFGMRVISESRNLIYVVIVPILAFFILKDGRRIRDAFIEIVGDRGEAVSEALGDIHTMLLQYMRALLYLCLATLTCFMIFLNVMGVPYATLLASIAFPLEFIPLVGPLIAALTIIGVSAFSGYSHVLWLIIFLGVYRTFQDYVLSPHLMSRGVELHPLLVIFGVFAGGEIGGVTGIFLSVPMLALIRLTYHRFARRRRIQTRPALTT
jgi:predicted PurR-regulated permease PerM